MTTFHATNPAPVPPRQPNPWDPQPGALFVHGFGTWQNRTYENVFPGDNRPISHLRYGTIFESGGERFIISDKTNRSSLIRSLDSGEHTRVPVDTFVRVLDYDQGAYVPPIGSFVQIVKGEHLDKIGMVVQPGKNSMHVVFPGSREVCKFTAQATKVVQMDIIPR